MKKILRKNGIMVHEIDLRSHSTSEKWNGHYGYSDFVWNLMKGNRKTFINREPYTSYIKEIERYKLKILHEDKRFRKSEIQKNKLNRCFKHFNDDDLQTWGLFFIAKK
ncbi:MAG: hypothetical protein IPJ03_00035 [Ignavibacteriales bacterium]|nr:hypothetical protein [Ignavibacteriales bacterium]